MSVETSAPGELSGSLTLTGPTGQVVIPVTAEVVAAPAKVVEAPAEVVEAPAEVVRRPAEAAAEAAAIQPGPRTTPTRGTDDRGAQPVPPAAVAVGAAVPSTTEVPPPADEPAHTSAAPGPVRAPGHRSLPA